MRSRFTPRAKEPRRNLQIRARELLVIDGAGKRLGVMSLKEALTLAEERGLDLIEVAAHLNPPVAKLVDWGKFKYEQKKQAQKRKQKVPELKEVRLSANIDQHDLLTKQRQLAEFLKKGHKVKLTVVFRKRQLAHRDLGEKLLNDQLAQMANSATLEQNLTRQGRMSFIVVAPQKKVSRVRD